MFAAAMIGAYGVRYLFVIYGFLVAETENLRSPFLLGRAPEREHLVPFSHSVEMPGQTGQFQGEAGGYGPSVLTKAESPASLGGSQKPSASRRKVRAREPYLIPF